MEDIKEPIQNNNLELKYTDDDLNKILTKEKYNARSSADKARQELLTELGITNLDEYKQSKSTKETEFKTLQDKLVEYETQFNSFKEKEFNLEAKFIAQKLNVKDEAFEDLLSLAKGKMSDKVTLQDAMSQVIEKYPSFLNAGKNDVGKAGLSFKEKEDKPQIKDENPFLAIFTNKK